MNGMRFEGGGIYCANSSPNLKKVVITDNKAMANGGGMVCSENANPFLENCTISNNIAESGFGGGIALYGSCASLLNTILWGNSPDEIYFFGLDYSRSCVTVSYTDILDSTKRIITNNNGDVYWHEGNMSYNPLFCNPDSCIYTLSEKSPCIGTGKDGKNIGALRVGCTSVGVIHKPSNLPIKSELSQNYPNPFNPLTNISFALPSRSFVVLKVFDLIGREIATLISKELPPGKYSRQWDASGMPSGVYFYRLHVGTFTETKKLILLR